MTILRVLLTVLISAIGFAQSGAQVNVWIGHGPQGGWVELPAFDPQNPGTMYVSSPDALFRTTDAGGHWSALVPRWVRVLAVDPTNSSTLYGGSPNGNTLVLLNSTDGGLTWNALGSLPTTYSSVTLAIDPGNPAILYAGCSAYDAAGGGVFKSTDAGNTWSAVSSGLPILQALNGGRSPGVLALLIDPTNPRTLYAASDYFGAAGGGVYKSTDAAASWHATGLTSFLDVLAMDPQNPNTLYGEFGGLVSRSTDGGATWAVISRSGPRGRHLVVDPQDSSTLYGVDDYSNDVMKSADGGGSWGVVLSVPLTSWVAVAPAAGGGSTVFAGGTGLGVFKSSDGGLTWPTANTGLIATDVISLAIDQQNPQKLYATVSGAGLFESADTGGNWSAAPGLPAGGPVPVIIVNPQNSSIVYAALNNGIYKSIDRGQSWQQLSLPRDFDSGLRPAIDIQAPDTLYAGGFKTTDGGATWMQLIGFAGALSTVATDPQNSGTLYAGSFADSEYAASVSSGVLKSVDGGNSWSGGNTIWQGVTVGKLLVDPSNSSIVYAETAAVDCDYYVCTDDYYSTVQQNIGVYRSADSGATWAKLDLPGGAPPVAYLVGIDQSGTVYATATGSQSGLFRSQDGGVTWSALPTNGLPGGGGGANVLAFDPQNPNHLFAGTSAGGVFEITLAQLQK
jgi:photosystem II stability/assembly factor-like uncharacterized protein